MGQEEFGGFSVNYAPNEVNKKYTESIKYDIVSCLVSLCA